MRHPARADVRRWKGRSPDRCRNRRSRFRSCRSRRGLPAAPADRSGWWHSALLQRSLLRCRFCRTGRCGAHTGHPDRPRCGTSSLFRRSRYPAKGSHFRCGGTGTGLFRRRAPCSCCRNCRNRKASAADRHPDGNCRKADSHFCRWGQREPPQQACRKRAAARCSCSRGQGTAPCRRQRSRCGKRYTS